jgi:tetratricopeptide (TPR) repeat protein
VFRSLVLLAMFSLRAVAPVAALIAILALTQGVARGQGGSDDTGAAKAHYATGVRHFDLSEFDEALAEFKVAYRNKPDPVFLYNIGQCHRKLGHTEEAINFYQSYLRRAPDAKNREEVERRIEELQSLREAESATITKSKGGEPRPSPLSQEAQRKAAAETASSPVPTGAGEFGARDQSSATTGSAIYKQWWFWTAIGAVAAGTATVAIMMAERDPTKVPSTSLGSQRALP